MKLFHSIRWRLQLWHGLLLALVLTGFGFTAWELQRADELSRIDQELELRILSRIDQELELRIETAADATHPGKAPTRPRLEAPLPPGLRDVHLPEREMRTFEGPFGSVFYYVVWLPDGRILSRSDAVPSDVPCPEPVAEPHSARLRGTLRECFHFSHQGVCILAGRDIARELAGLHRSGWLLAGAGGLVLLLGLTGGWWVSARTLRPVADISATAIKISTGDLSQRIQTSNTDSELGQLVQVLNSTFARLDAAFTRQARFTADAAHELRTPLTVMLTHAQNGLDSDCPNEEHREAFEASRRAARHMRRLTEALLTLAELDSGRADALKKTCHLDRITRDSVELLRPLADGKGLSLHLDLEPAQCEGNEGQLGQAVSNLVSNAIHYNRPGGSVRVTTAPGADSILLTVCDTGQGIAPEDLPHIFERFYRADKARSSAAGSTGLGLAITKAIVEAHSGTLSVATVLGKGTTFTLRLPTHPIVSSDPPSASSSTAAPALPNTLFSNNPWVKQKSD